MGNEQKLISVVIPSYNDKAIIIPYYEAIKNFLSSQTRYDWELIYVDDGSTDGSISVIRELALLDERIVFIELARNFGQQSALFCGLQESRGDIAITLDGDFQYPPQVITQLADKIMEGYDIVSGIRIKRNDPFMERFTSKIGQFFIEKVIGARLSDFGSVKGFSRFIVDHILKNKMYMTQIYGLTYLMSNRHCEIPVEHLRRYEGKSKWKFWMRFEMYYELFLFFGKINLSPIFFMSSLMFIVGLIYLLAVLVSSYFFNYRIGTGIGSLILISTGLIIFFVAIAINIILKIYRSIAYKEFIVIRSISGKK